VARAKEPDRDRIVTAIEVTERMLGGLKNGLLTGEPLQDLERLAREISIATTAIETLITLRYDQGRNKIV
jgi:hypothetical protein